MARYKPSRSLLLVLTATLLLGASPSALAAPPEGFEERVETLRQSLEVPGVAIAIVEGEQTTLTRGFGITDLSAPRAVDADTLFFTGSTGKAFTAAALAVLVDQGKLAWDDPVIDHMPDFRMHDAWVTREMTVRDLLVHRSGLGLGAGDLLFVPRSSLSREEIVRRIRHIPPATSFRSGYAYDNILYIAAGRLIEEVSGQSWEQFLTEQVLRPAGMAGATVDQAGRMAAANRARPHARLNGPIRGMGDQEPLRPDAIIAQVAAPAGGLSISANDMSRWLALQLAQGALPNGSRLFSEAASREMWKPAVLMPVNPLPEPLRQTQPLFSTYALGWNVRDYRGHRLIMHGGAVYGSLAIVVLLPDQDVGFSIAINSEDGALVQGLAYELIDHYLGHERVDWTDNFRRSAEGRRAAAVNALQTPSAQRAESNPSLPLERYTGRFNDPWFGTIELRQEAGELQVRFPHWPDLTASLAHWQYDTFRTVFSDPAVEPAYVTFGIDADGRVDRITMRPVSPIADFSYNYRDLEFTPAPEVAQ